MELNKIYIGNALEILREFPDNFIDMCITSPPYWNLRDYGVDGQIGLEKTPEEYIDNLITIFDWIQLKLKNTGTCWVNIGDTYYNKSLANIPELFSIGMKKSGWYKRNTIIWHKPNCMPSSVKDRFTVDFEYLFFFTKNKKYYFEQQIEPAKDVSIKRYEYGLHTRENEVVYPGNRKNGFHSTDKMKNYFKDPKNRNKRTVWKIVPKSYKGAHFAIFPEKSFLFSTKFTAFSK